MIEVQVPNVPAWSQASHCPSHARSQQTPSAQKLDPHSSPLAHEVPASFAHVPFLLTEQLDPEEQPITAQHTPSVQKAPEGHVDASVQGSPSFEAGRAVQTFEVHVKPTAQSVGDVQADLQADVPQT